MVISFVWKRMGEDEDQKKLEDRKETVNL